jgi:hypothetical protein
MPMSDSAAASELLSELTEARAIGEARRIFGEIKGLCGVPMVALIYRHLATIPGALEWSWSLLEPLFRSGELQRRAWRLATDALGDEPVPPISRAALRAVGIEASDEAAIVAVLDAYNRANPVNILAVRCLALHLAEAVRGTAAATPLPQWTPPPAPAPLPAIIDPRGMTSDVRELVMLLTDRGSTSSPSTLWPSLYRHLAHWPAMLGYASVVIAPRFAQVDAVAARLREQMDLAASELAARVAPSPDVAAPTSIERANLKAAIDQFSWRIPEMVAIGGLLRRALPSPT